MIWLSWQIVRRLRQPLPPWSRIFDELQLQENSSPADFISRLALPDVSKVSWMRSRCHTFITEELGTVFLSLFLILKCPKSGKDLFQKKCSISLCFSVNLFSMQLSLRPPTEAFHHLLCKQKLFLGTTLTDILLRLWAGQLSYCWICFVLNNLYFFRPNHVLASQFRAAGEGFSFNVATSKLP